MWVSISVLLRAVLDNQSCFYITRRIEDWLLKGKPIPPDVIRVNPEVFGVRLREKRLWFSRLDLEHAQIENLFAFDLVPRFPILKPIHPLTMLSIEGEETRPFRVGKTSFRISVCNLRLDLKDPARAEMASQIAGWKIQRGKNHTHIGALMLNHIFWLTEQGIRFILTIPIAPWVTTEKTVVGVVTSVQTYPAFTERLIRAIDGQNRSLATVHLQI